MSEAGVFVVLVLGFAALFIVGVVWQYDQASETGNLMYYMSKAQVLNSWGEPAEVEMAGFGLYLRETWIYRDPFRSVSFGSSGFVQSWVRAR